MTAFASRSRNSRGEIVEKTLEGASLNEVLMHLESQGLFPIDVKPLAEGAQPGSPPSTQRVRGRVKRKDLMQFSIQLSSALGAGVAIFAALQSIRQQTQNAALARVLEQMCRDLEEGLSLSAAMRRHPKVFPHVYVGTIEAGEKSGTLDDMLDNLAEYLEAEMEVRSDVRSAVLYPAIVISTLCIAITVLIVFIVPRFAAFYSGFDAELPLPTRILITSSSLVSDHYVPLLLALGGLVFGVRRALRRPRLREMVDRKALRVPLVGTLLETSTTLHVVQMLGLFSRAGVPLLESLRTIANTVANTKFRNDLLAVADGVSVGDSLTSGLEARQCFPMAARHMIANGEATGTMERACESVARRYKKELRYLTKNVATFIEPLLTLVLAVVVLFVALAVFLPMWDLVKVVG